MFSGFVPVLQASGSTRCVYRIEARFLDLECYRNRYVRSKRAVSNTSPSELQKRRRVPFESQFRKLAGEFGLDWRLVAAQASVENGFNPEAVSGLSAGHLTSYARDG